MPPLSLNARPLADQPMLILHGIWMEKYEGWEKKIYAAGFSYPQVHGWAGEMFNFRDVGGKYYGHVEISPRKVGQGSVDPQLRIEALGATKSDPVAHDVLVVWTAPDPRKPGRTVVGWYKNATVYRHFQEPKGSLRKLRTFKGVVCSYRVEAEAQNCRILPLEERKLTLPPRKGKDTGGPGRFGAFYPASHGASGRSIEKKIRHFIETGKLLGARPHKKPKSGRSQPDPELKAKIEKTAFKCVWAHFEKLGYECEDLQKDNKGYDLIARNEAEVLCVEVKGRGGSDIAADFTRNEYEKILEFQRGIFADGSYRICIVTDALSSRTLHHFMYYPSESRKGDGTWWSVGDKHQLTLQPVTAARGVATSGRRRK